MKINGVNVHGLKSAVGNYNRMLNVIGTAYIMFDTRDGEVWAQTDNYRRNLSMKIVGYPPNYGGDNAKATMDSAKAEIAWLTSEKGKQLAKQLELETDDDVVAYLINTERREKAAYMARLRRWNDGTRRTG